MPAVVAVSQLQAKAGRRDELIELLKELAVSIHAEPGDVHYSVSQAIDDEDGPLAIVQVCSSLDAFREHSAWMRPNIPRLAGLLAAPPAPPTLFEQVSLGGNPKESFAA
jgi:quinol monooxygenase YgiN